MLIFYSHDSVTNWLAGEKSDMRKLQFKKVCLLEEGENFRT